MGTVKKIGEEYYIEFEARGLKYQQKAGPSEADAYRLLKEVEEKIEKGQMGVITRDVELDIFFTDFGEYVGSQHTIPTVKRLHGVIEHFEKFLDLRPQPTNRLSQVTPMVLEEYKMYLQKMELPGRPANHPRVINLTFFLLSDIFQYAIKLGYLNDNPTLHIRLLKILAINWPQGLNEEELHKVREETAPWFKPLIEFVLLTGLRWSELAGLQWSHIDRLKGTMTVGASDVSWREIPISLKIGDILNTLERNRPATVPYVFRDPFGQPWDAQSLCLQFQELLYNCGLKNSVGVDCLRHTFAINLLKKGVALASLYKYLGLSDIAKAMVYAPFIPEKRKELYE
jgi:site-specific recombinase XerD